MNPSYGQEQQPSSMYGQPLQQSESEGQSGLFNFPHLHVHGNEPVNWGQGFTYIGGEGYRGESGQQGMGMTSWSPVQYKVIQNEPLLQECVHHRVIEEIQPVIQREIVQPFTHQIYKPIYEKVVEAPIIMQESRPVQALPREGLPMWYGQQQPSQYPSQQQPSQYPSQYPSQQQPSQYPVQQQPLQQQQGLGSEWSGSTLSREVNAPSTSQWGYGQQQSRSMPGQWGWWENQPQGQRLGIVGPYMPPSPKQGYSFGQEHQHHHHMTPGYQMF